MKKNNILWGILSCLVVILASVLGADASFAMADVPISSGTAVPETDESGLATQLNGTAATGSHATETDFEKEEIDQEIAVYRPYLTPLEYDIMKNAVQVKVKSYHPIHYRSGAAIMNAVVDDTVGSNTATTTKVTIASGADCLTEYRTVYAKGVPGYNGTTEDGELALFVTKVEGSGVTMMALNGSTDVSYTIPELDGKTLIIGATAGAESQMIVDPDNYQPVPKEVYLQKKLSNIVFTDEWLEQAKKVPFIEKDIRQNALYNFNRGCSRTHWLGVKKKLVVDIAEAKLGKQNVYFEEGLLRQIPMFYAYANDKIDFADLNALGKLQFTKHSVNSTARAYCGKNYIERLMNMDMTVHKEFEYRDYDEAGMSIRAWKNNFGEIQFVHDPTLDDIGYEDFAVIVDIKNAVRYVKRDEKAETIDLSKGAGETHEAKREVFSIIDCICLKGYNAVLMGPADQMGLVAGLGGITGYGTTFAGELDAETGLYEFTGEETEGTIYYLTPNDITWTDAASVEHVFKAGSIVIYEGGVWKEYDGIIAA